MFPIVGVRYQCSVCGDFDLCERCEAAGAHSHHTMLKIRKPSQAPVSVVAQYNQPLPKEALAALSNQELLQSLGSLGLGSGLPVKPKRHPDAQRFLARFVRESIHDKHEVQPGETFTKSWTFRNHGEAAWPDDVLFCQSTGDDMGASVDSVRCRVHPGNEWTFTVSFKAPMLPGKYTSFFRLQTGNIKFGHKAWCDIMVTEGAKALGNEEESKEGMVPVDKNSGDMVQASQDQSSTTTAEKAMEGLATSTISLDSHMKSPKQLYMEKVEALDDA